MNKLAGLWIDHSKAVIVVIKNEVEIKKEILSHLEEHGRLPTASDLDLSASTGRVYSEAKLTRQYLALFDHYYDEVISEISDADSIWIFGPGEAKAELENRLKQKGFGARIVGIETVEKMNDRKIAAIVREHFLRKRNAREYSRDMKKNLIYKEQA